MQCEIKNSGKKSNLENYLNSGEINHSKNLWLQISQEELIVISLKTKKIRYD